MELLGWRSAGPWQGCVLKALLKPMILGEQLFSGRYFYCLNLAIDYGV